MSGIYEPIRIFKEGDADYPEIMQYVPNKSKYTIVQIGETLFVPLFQVINKLQVPECRHYFTDEDGQVNRECEEW